MATNQNLKDALSFPAELNNPITDQARTIGNAALVRLAAALEAEFDFQEELGRAPNADDAARYLYGVARRLVSRHEQRQRVSALPPLPLFKD